MVACEVIELFNHVSTRRTSDQEANDKPMPRLRRRGQQTERGANMQMFGKYRRREKDATADRTATRAAMLSVAMIPRMVQRIAGKTPGKHVVRILCFLVCLCSYDARSMDSWTFFQDADRPVKAVAIGDSITAYTQGSFVAFLQAACPRLEVVNLGKSLLGADALHERFLQQVLRNPRIDLHGDQTVWMIYQGGLNSVEDPATTNHAIRWTFIDAHRAGLKVMGLSLLPWGAEHDRRWRETRGLTTWSRTRQVVDFVMGRLSPREALGLYVQNHPARWEAEELPDIAVDVYDSALRDRAAPLRQLPDVHTLVQHTAWVQLQLRDLSPAAQEETINAYAQQTLALPRWFMQERFQGLDHFHPNREGHRLAWIPMNPTASNISP
jgi:hypothetical protein